MMMTFADMKVRAMLKGILYLFFSKMKKKRVSKFGNFVGNVATIMFALKKSIMRDLYMPTQEPTLWSACLFKNPSFVIDSYIISRIVKELAATQED